MRSSRLHWLAIAPILSVWLAGCASGPTPADRFYRVRMDTSGVDVFASPPLDGVVEVERFRADGLTRERAIVYSEGPGSVQVQRHRYDHWVEPPVDMLQEELVGYLRARQVARGVVTPQMRLRSDVLVSGRLAHFERVNRGDGPGVFVELRVDVKDVRRGSLLWTARYRALETAPGDDVPAAVAGFGNALAVVFEALCDDLAALPAAPDSR